MPGRNEPQLKDIKIVWSNNLPEAVRLEHGIPTNKFVEVRMESASPPKPRFITLDGLPTARLRDCFNGAGLLGTKF